MAIRSSHFFPPVSVMIRLSPPRRLLVMPCHARHARSRPRTQRACAAGQISAAEVIDILKPIWNTKPETARRVLNKKHKAQWRSHMQAYVFPSIGKRPSPETELPSAISVGAGRVLLLYGKCLQAVSGSN